MKRKRLLAGTAAALGVTLLALLVGAWASRLQISVARHPGGDASNLAGLAHRDDLSVLFILIDTLRADHLGCYGYERATSPALDRLASTGVRFANVRAQSSWTKSSMASLWTGAYPVTTGVTRYSHAIDDSVAMPAEVLDAAGYVTGGIFRNGWVDPDFGFAQGFAIYMKPVPSRVAGRIERHRSGSARIPGTDLDVTDAAVEFLRTERAERFLLYVHYMDVHQYAYEEGSALFGAGYEDAYDNAIHWVDRNVAMLIAELDRLGLRDRTIVVVASDHGEAFYEHGHEGHARDLYGETTTTPLILGLPFRLESPIVVEPLVRNVDVWPTLLALLGLPPLPDAEGRSLLPLALASAGLDVETSPPEVAFAHLDRSWGRVDADQREIVSVTRDAYRLHVAVDDSARGELYDLNEDPGEQYDVADQHPVESEELLALARGFARRQPSAGVTREVEISEMKLHLLRALGYAVDAKSGREQSDREAASVPRD